MEKGQKLSRAWDFFSSIAICLLLLSLSALLRRRHRCLPASPAPSAEDEDDTWEALLIFVDPTESPADLRAELVLGSDSFSCSSCKCLFFSSSFPSHSLAGVRPSGRRL